MANRNRDDFAASVKNAAAKRAGQRCANPNCLRPTSGPHENPTSAVNIGVAAHITAASKGGPRFDASLTSQERSGMDNCIWLCQTCAKVIDSNPLRYTKETLNQWRLDHELRMTAQLQGSLCDKMSLIPANQMLALHFTLNSFPYIEFSIVNRSNSHIQLTSLNAVLSASIKFETKMTRYAFGSRMNVEIDLSQMQRGIPVRLLGESSVANLAPGEAGAFRLGIKSENTLNLIILEAQVVSSHFDSPITILLDKIVLCASESEMSSGAIVDIPRMHAFDVLCKSIDREKNIDSEYIAGVPQQTVEDAFARGAAYICDCDVSQWRILRKHFEHHEHWGSILASFSECLKYLKNTEIEKYIDQWLSTPELIQKISCWDNEIRSVTILMNRIKGIPECERGEYLLKMMGKTFLTTIDRTKMKPSSLDDTFQFLRELSLVYVQDKAAEILSKCLNSKAIEPLIAFLMTYPATDQIAKNLEKKVYGETEEIEYKPPEYHADKWLGWWVNNKAKYYGDYQLNKIAPTVAKCLEARLATKNFTYKDDDHWLIKKNFVLNSHLPNTLLSKFAEDKSVNVRLEVARRDCLPQKAVELLVCDEQDIVRFLLARNICVPMKMLKILAKDSNEKVSLEANRTISKIEGNDENTV